MAMKVGFQPALALSKNSISLVKTGADIGADLPAVWHGSQDQCPALCGSPGPHGAGGAALSTPSIQCRCVNAVMYLLEHDAEE